MEFVTPGAANLRLFAAAAVALLVIPGPAVLYIVSRSAEQGRRAGLVSVAGIHAATLVHLLAALVGLSAVLAASSFAFGVVKYAGAAYLIWLGLRKLFSRTAATDALVPPPRREAARIFRDGFVVNLLNPKTALFFLAFLPQFVDLGRGHVSAQIAILGGLFVALGLVSDGCYAFAAGAAGGWLRQSQGWAVVERYVGGLVMIGLGATAALTGHEKQ